MYNNNASTKSKFVSHATNLSSGMSNFRAPRALRGEKKLKMENGEWKMTQRKDRGAGRRSFF